MSKLSPREIQVVELFSSGLNGVKIARTLGISAKTIATHKARIRRKLGLVRKSEWKAMLAALTQAPAVAQ